MNELRMLRKGQVVSYSSEQASTYLVDGSLWITIEGDSNDYIAESGQRFSTVPHRLTVIEALEDTEIFFLAENSKNIPFHRPANEKHELDLIS